MSVVLAELESDEPGIREITLSASNYDAPLLLIEQGDKVIYANRKQLQGISIAIDRFLDD